MHVDLSFTMHGIHLYNVQGLSYYCRTHQNTHIKYTCTLSYDSFAYCIDLDTHNIMYSSYINDKLLDNLLPYHQLMHTARSGPTVVMY